LGILRGKSLASDMFSSDERHNKALKTDGRCAPAP
jgi:hypothetical protein